MAGRPKEFDEALALEKVADIFWQNGYEATSTNDVLVGMKINKGSLYNSFGSKRELFSRTLEFFQENAMRSLQDTIYKDKNPLEGIKTFFRSIATAEPSAYDKGCFMGNTLAEISNIDAELKQKAANYLKEMQAIFYKALITAQKEGLLSSSHDANLLADYLLNLWNGINITRRIYTDVATIKALIDFQLSIID